MGKHILEKREDLSKRATRKKKRRFLTRKRVLKKNVKVVSKWMGANKRGREDVKNIEFAFGGRKLRGAGSMKKSQSLREGTKKGGGLFTYSGC